MGRSFPNVAGTPEAVRENVDRFAHKELFFSLLNTKTESEKI